MSNRYAIHLETPVGLQFDGMVEADSLHEAAMKWAWDSDRDVPRGAAIVVQDPNYNEEGKLRFTVLAPNGCTDVYGATECIYVASEFDPKALFREMAVHYENPDKDTGVDTWTGMRVFELLNIPGLTCHEGIWQALSDEQRARCESIARAINRNSAPRSEPIDHDFATAKEVRPAESASLRIWLAKDDADLNKQMDSMSGNWPGASGPYCFDVEIGDGDATIVGGDPDPLYRGEVAVVSKTNKHGAGIRIRRDAQDDYIYIFPSVSAYPKEESKLGSSTSCDESKQNIPDRFDAAGFEWLQNEILNDLQRRVDTSPEFEMRQAFQRAGSDVARTFALMRRAIHLTPIDDLATRQATHIARAGRESGHEQP